MVWNSSRLSEFPEAPSLQVTEKFQLYFAKREERGSFLHFSDAAASNPHGNFCKARCSLDPHVRRFGVGGRAPAGRSGRARFGCDMMMPAVIDSQVNLRELRLIDADIGFGFFNTR